MRLVWPGIIGIGLIAFWIFNEYWGQVGRLLRAGVKSPAPGFYPWLMPAARVLGIAGVVLLLIGFFG